MGAASRQFALTPASAIHYLKELSCVTAAVLCLLGGIMFIIVRQRRWSAGAEP